jgi:hypothetical protein
MQTAIFSKHWNCSQPERLPALHLYSNLEIIMSQPGVGVINVFLTPENALELAGQLIALAQKEIGRRK